MNEEGVDLANEADHHQIFNSQANDILPLNTISEDSVKYLKQLLESHENLLKTTLNEYETLKQNYKEVLHKSEQL